MHAPSNQDRIRNLYQMLFEMATGNLSFRIQKSGKDDELDELAALLNTLATAMQRKIPEAGHIIPYYTYQSLLQSTFVLDQNFSIKSFSANVSSLLGLKPNALLTKAFAEILAPQSRALWLSTIAEVENDPNFHATIQLIFITASNQVIPSFCTISRLLYSNKILISTLTTVLQDLYDEHSGQIRNIDPKPGDATVIQSVHDYILSHLEEPLPPIKELSKLFGTNEHKIKDGFRHFFDTSIYQFYNEERLKKAHLLIQQGNTPLKEIAFSCGFNAYLNFYKAFKKRFKYPPSQVYRNTGES